MEYKLGELFCGPGGLALGAMNARFGNSCIAHAWANDYDLDSCLTYSRNICGGTELKSVWCEDVREFLRLLPNRNLKEIDIFAYGFPCNDFSIVGESKGFEGKFGPLYTTGIQILNTFKPKVFVAENVGGIRSSNEGLAFVKILEDLEKAGNGYRLFPHLYRCEQYGIPQSRHRVVIVGIDSTLKKEFKVPSPTHLAEVDQVTSREALENPPIPAWAENQERTNQSKLVVERLKRIKPGQNAWNSDLPDHLKLNVKGAKLSQIYRRLHPNKPSYTITGSGGGGTHGYHWAENRALTNRERARIQTFPDDFVFVGKKESVRKQIGMAVPPSFSKVIFESVLKTLSGEDYEYCSQNLSFESNGDGFQFEKLLEEAS